MSPLAIARGWSVVTADGKRVGDVTEVHPHYLLVSRGVILVKDLYLPLGAVERLEGTTVILSVTQEALKRMDLAHEPAPLAQPEPAPLQDPAAPSYEAPSYEASTPQPEETAPYGEGWMGGDDSSYEEMPTYTRPQPNGLVEVEPGLNLAFQDHGYGSTVLLMQGWPFDSTVWEPLPAMLAQEYRVVSYDPRGLGGSDRPWDYYSVEMLSNDLHRLIVEQALRDVTVVAWSTAAVPALIYAREHRQRVARLVLLSPLIPYWLAVEPAALGLEGHIELDEATQAAWAADLLEDRAALHERLLDRLTHTPLSGPRRHWLWQRLMLGAPHAQIKTWEALRGYDPAYALPEVAVPVTVLSGEHDRLAPPGLAAYLAGKLPRAQHIVLGDCGHALFLDGREAVLKAVHDLLRISYEPPEQPAQEEGEAALSGGDGVATG